MSYDNVIPIRKSITDQTATNPIEQTDRPLETTSTEAASSAVVTTLASSEKVQAFLDALLGEHPQFIFKRVAVRHNDELKARTVMWTEGKRDLGKSGPPEYKRQVIDALKSIDKIEKITIRYVRRAVNLTFSASEEPGKYAIHYRMRELFAGDCLRFERMMETDYGLKVVQDPPAQKKRGRPPKKAAGL
jgi:hypothetical protein